MRWRKATWALIIWTALMAYMLYDGLQRTEVESAEKYGVFYWIILGLSLLFTWLIGLIILAAIWFMSRPKANTPIYGPQGQWMRVTEKEAKRRVEKEDWTYQPPRFYPQPPYPPQPYQGQPPPSGGPPQWPPAGSGQP